MTSQFHTDHFPLPGVSANLIEAVNAVLSICLLWMLAFGVLHFIRLYRQMGRRSVWRKIRGLYETAKPEIALMTVIGSLWAQRTLITYLRHEKNIHEMPPDFILKNGSMALVVTTIISIIGASCWIRVISPFEEFTARWIWLAMIAISLGVGFFLAYY